MLTAPITSANYTCFGQRRHEDEDEANDDDGDGDEKGKKATTYADNTITGDVTMVGQRIQSRAGTALITSGIVGRPEGMYAVDYLTQLVGDVSRPKGLGGAD